MSSGQAQQPGDSAEGQAQQEQTPAEALPLPFPVEIIKDDAEAKARERRESEARQREIDDLAAQEGMNAATQAMNEATQRMADDSREMVTATWVGVVLLIGTLLLMWQANRAAVAAVEVTREIGQCQIRAYVISDPNMDWQEAFIGNPDNIVGYNFTLKWKNCGSSPARRCQVRTSLQVFDGFMPRNFDFPDKASPEITDTNHIGPGQTVNTHVGGLSLADADAVENGTKHVYVWGWVEYDDIFGKTRRRTEACYDLRIGRNKDGRFCRPTIYGPFNGADEDCHHKPKT